MVGDRSKYQPSCLAEFVGTKARSTTPQRRIRSLLTRSQPPSSPSRLTSVPISPVQFRQHRPTRAKYSIEGKVPHYLTTFPSKRNPAQFGSITIDHPNSCTVTTQPHPIPPTSCRSPRSCSRLCNWAVRNSLSPASAASSTCDCETRQGDEARARVCGRNAAAAWACCFFSLICK